MNSHRADRSSRCNHAELRHAPKNTSDPYTSRSLTHSLFLRFLLSLSRSRATTFSPTCAAAAAASPLLHRYRRLSTSSLTLTHPFPAWAALRPLADVLAPYRLVISAEESDYSKLSRSTGFTVSILSPRSETCRCLARCEYYHRFYRRLDRAILPREFAMHFRTY